MARSRNIKPGFFTNDVLGELPALTRLLFAGLWTICDREGRIEDRPKKIRAEVLPYDACDADEMLQALEKSGFIERYEVSGVRVIQVLAWDKHQNPHIKEGASTLPAKHEHQTSTVQERCEAQPLPERAGLIPDSLSLDSLNTDSLKEDTPRKRSAPPPSVVKPDDVDPQTWADWCQLRKAKRATVSLTVIDGARNEAAKAGMSLESFLKVWCRRGSQGLEAEWLKSNERPQAAVPPVESFAERDERRARERIAEATGTAVKQPNDMGMVIDITPQRISA